MKHQIIYDARSDTWQRENTAQHIKRAQHPHFHRRFQPRFHMVITNKKYILAKGKHRPRIILL